MLGIKVIWKVSYCTHLLNQSGVKNRIIYILLRCFLKISFGSCSQTAIFQSVLFNNHYFHCIYHQSVPEYPDKIQAIIKPGKINVTVVAV